jgi:UDP-N-acetylmuramoyl-L-alanyl-D-glutamate--2,6-diaminopimelate ligase
VKIFEDVLPQQFHVKSIGDTKRKVNDIILDSRKIKTGDVFVAIKGYAMDGHDFIEKAIISGAAYVVLETHPTDEQLSRWKEKGVTVVQVKNSRESLAEMAIRFYDQPSHQLKLIGVTGTNGKTTTATMLYDLYQKLGYKVGLISTIENKIHNEIVSASLTTPDAISLTKLLADMVEANCDIVFMEVSSHAIHQKRLYGQKFSGGIFTNISRDHLDYHNSFKEYIDVKKQFFDLLDNDAFALVNVDDRHGNYMVQNTKATSYTYSLRTLVDYKTKVLANNLEGLQLNINGSEVYAMFTGLFNAYNVTAAYATAEILGEDKAELLQALSAVRPAEGRFDIIRGEKKPIYAIVDYAHTPDALKNILTSVRSLMSTGKLITVVGCGGNRDKGKRPLMAAIAAQLSESVIFTSDNPRDEDPFDILMEMESGVSSADENKIVIIENRKQAIKTAVQLASENDVIVVAGKGHEKYQEIKGKKIPFDDKLILKALLL